MKKLILSATVAFTVLTTSNIYAQQGFGTNTPDRSSAVDIVSSKRGLLIPRIDIPNLDQAAPVSNPANALMVYNTGKTTAAGFYYWDANFEHTDKSKGRWVRFVSSNSGSAVTVSEGTNVSIDKTTNGHDTDYKVSVKGGTAPNQVLVTKLGDNNTYVSKWVNPEEFLKDVVTGTNGVKTEIIKDDKGNVVNTVVKLGGDLTEQTVLNTGKGKELAITGLETLAGKDAETGTKFNSTDDKVVVMGADGILKNVSAKDLVEDAIDKGSINGKALTSKGNSIQIDGDVAKTALLKDVNIEVKGGEKDGQILVSTPKLDDKGQPVIDDKGNPVYVTKWVDAAGNTVKSGQGVTVKEDNTVNLGGKITNNGTTPGAVIDLTDDKGAKAGDIAIKGLEELVGKDATTGTKLDTNTDKLVVADKDGVLKQTSAKNLIEDAIEKGTDDTDPLKAKTLKGDGITVTATGASDVTDNVANALLKDVTLGIEDGAVSTSKIADGAVTHGKIDAGAVSQEKLYAGTIAADGTKTPADEGNIPVANADGTVTYKPLNTAVGAADLLTDGKIVIGDNTSAVQRAGGIVLAETTLSIKAGSIGTTELTNGAVRAEKMTANVGDDNAPKGYIPVAGDNGTVTYQQVTGELLNGKALTSPTGSISVSGSGAKALLDATTIDIKGGTSVGQVLVTKEGPVENNVQTYITEWVTPESLGNTVTASNGLTKTDNDIALGGTIDKEAKLVIAPGTTNPDGTVIGGGSLVIDGLGTAAKDQTNKTVVVQADGKLATVDTAARNVTINQVENVTIGGDNSIVNNYHPSMSEIVIEVTLGTTDTNLSLPAVNGTEGQTISVKIVNEDEKHNGYLNIISSEGTIAYGAMPFQGWIIKSNGTKWIVVGRN